MFENKDSTVQNISKFWVINDQKNEKTKEIEMGCAKISLSVVL